MRRSTVVAATVSLMSVAALAGAGAAHAAFPGTNGLIAYPGGGALFTVDPAIFPPVTQRLTQGGVFNAVNFSADGRMLAASETAGIVFLEPKPGATIVPLPGGDASDRNPSFDPTGTRVTFQNANDIFIQNVDGTGRANLTSAFANSVNQPEWSPDGQFIAFEDDTDAQIKKISVADGTITTLTPPAANCAGGNPCQEPNWAPDGLTVAYDVDAVNPGIYEVASDGGAAAPLRLSNGNDDLPAVSPQDDQVVFQDSVSDLATVPTSGSLVKTNIGNIGTGRMSWGVKQPAPVLAPPPSNEFTFGAVTRDKKRGTANLTVNVPGPGELAMGGAGIVPQRPAPWAPRRATKPVTGPGGVVLLVKAAGTTKKRLKKKGKATVIATITFTPTGGTPTTQVREINLQRKRKRK